MGEKERSLEEVVEELLSLLINSDSTQEDKEYYRSIITGVLADALSATGYNMRLAGLLGEVLPSLPFERRSILVRFLNEGSLGMKPLLESFVSEENDSSVYTFTRDVILNAPTNVIHKYWSVLIKIHPWVGQDSFHGWCSVLGEGVDYDLLFEVLGHTLEYAHHLRNDDEYSRFIFSVGYSLYYGGVSLKWMEEVISVKRLLPSGGERGEIIKKFVLSFLPVETICSLEEIAKDLGVPIWERRPEFFWFSIPESDMVKVGDNLYYVIPRALYLEYEEKTVYNGGYIILRIPGMVRVDLDQAPKEEILEGLMAITPQPQIIVETQKGYSALWDLDDFIENRRVIEDLPGVDLRYNPQSFVRVSAKIGRPKDELKVIKGPQWLKELVSSLRDNISAYIGDKYITLYRWVFVDWEEEEYKMIAASHLWSSYSIWFALSPDAHRGTYGDILIEVDVSLHAFMVPPVPYWTGGYDTPPDGNWGRSGGDLVFDTEFLRRYIKEVRIDGERFILE